MYQAFAIGQAIMSTYAGAAKALEQEGIWGIVQAGLIIAQGMAYVAMIAAQKPGGTATTVASPSGGGGYSYTAPTTPSWGTTTEQKPRTQITNYYYYINGTVFGDLDSAARALTPAIEKAKGDGAH
jgi:hypothetical protein